MWEYTTSNSLTHFGVMGMKWGHRKNEQLKNDLPTSSTDSKRHLGIDKHGNISLIKEPTTKAAKKAFILKTTMFVGSILVTEYVATHLQEINKGEKYVNDFLNSFGKKTTSEMSGIFSKSLGRELTFIEAFEAGFDMKD